MQVIVFTDGGSRGNPGISGYGLVISDDHHKILFQEARFLGVMTNNEAEYSGLIGALNWLVQNRDKYGISEVHFNSDSQLLVRQLQGVYRVKAPNIKPLFNSAQTLLSRLNIPYKFTDVRREFNQLADQLANQAMDSAS